MPNPSLRARQSVIAVARSESALPSPVLRASHSALPGRGVRLYLLHGRHEQKRMQVVLVEVHTSTIMHCKGWVTVNLLLQLPLVGCGVGRCRRCRWNFTLTLSCTTFCCRRHWSDASVAGGSSHHHYHALTFCCRRLWQMYAPVEFHTSTVIHCKGFSIVAVRHDWPGHALLQLISCIAVGCEQRACVHSHSSVSLTRRYGFGCISVG